MLGIEGLQPFKQVWGFEEVFKIYDYWSGYLGYYGYCYDNEEFSYYYD